MRPRTFVGVSRTNKEVFMEIFMDDQCRSLQLSALQNTNLCHWLKFNKRAPNSHKILCLGLLSAKMSWRTLECPKNTDSGLTWISHRVVNSEITVRSQWGNMVSSQETNSQWAHCCYCIVSSSGDLTNSSQQARSVSCKLTEAHR